MKAVWTVARRELKAMFDTPTGYVLLVVFIVANSFLFFRQAFLSSAASLRLLACHNDNRVYVRLYSRFLHEPYRLGRR